jgi:hypothetical protein
MTQFEFISVFASIVLGLGLAHLLTGAIQQVYRRQIDYKQCCYAVMALLLIVLNWWGLFAWKDSGAWNLVQFLVLVLWSLSMFALCVAVYPPGEIAMQGFGTHLRVVLFAIAIVASLDITQTALHGALFMPVSYLPVVLHFVVLALVATAIRNTLAQKVIATYFPLATFLWGFVWTAGAMSG